MLDSDLYIFFLFVIYLINDWYEWEIYDFFGIIFDGYLVLIWIEMFDDW